MNASEDAFGGRSSGRCDPIPLRNGPAHLKRTARPTSILIARLWLVLTVISFLLPPTLSLAIDYYVDGASGNDANSGLSETDAWKTIGQALASTDGTPRSPVTIHVADGTYSASTNGEVFPLILEKYTHLVGISPESTTLDGESGDESIIALEGVWGVSIERLRLMGCSTAAIHCTDSELWLTGCVITENSVDQYETSALHASQSFVTVKNCWFYDNQGGRVVNLSESSVTLANCYVGYNSAQACRCGDSALLISNCLIQNNTSDVCPVLRCWQSDARIRDTRIEGNVCTGSGFSKVSAVSSDYSSCWMNRCAIECNESNGPLIETTAKSYPKGRTLSLEDSLVQGNISNWQAAIYSDDSSYELCAQSRSAVSSWHGLTLHIQRCTFSQNKTSDDYADDFYLIYVEPYSNLLGGTLRDTVLWGNDGRSINWTHTGSDQDRFPIEYCCLQEPANAWGNFSADPLFTDGPLGDLYLSSAEAGQNESSPCIDAGSTTAAAAGLSYRTTRTDGVGDAGMLDIGYHYSAAPPTIECTVGRASEPLTLDTEATQFQPGDVLRASITISNDGPPVWVDVYAAFFLPDGSLRCITYDGLTGELVPFSSALMLPQGLEAAEIGVLEEQIAEGLPAGTYTFAAVLSLTYEFRPITGIAETRFVIDDTDGPPSLESSKNRL